MHLNMQIASHCITERRCSANAKPSDKQTDRDSNVFGSPREP